MKRICKGCGDPKDITLFPFSYNKSCKPGHRLLHCKSCTTKKTAGRAAAYRRKLKTEALAAYSPDGIPRCSCKKCPEHTNPHIEFLVLDHVNGGGNEHRRKLKAKAIVGWEFYKWLKTNNYPPGYAILCHNCNFVKGKSTSFRCPHEDDEAGAPI